MGERIIDLSTLAAVTIAAVVLTDLLLSLALVAVRLLAEKPPSVPRPRARMGPLPASDRVHDAGGV